MSIRRKSEPEDENELRELPVVEPMEPEAVPEFIEEFCARHEDRPGLAVLPENRGACFSLSEEPDAAIFLLQVCDRSITFISGIDFVHTEHTAEALATLFEQLQPGVAFGQLRVTADGVDWCWDSPRLLYPYFHGNVTHAVVYAEYLAEFLWPVVLRLVNGELTPEAALAILLPAE